MDFYSLSAHVQQFIAAIRTRPTASTHTALHQSLNAWLTYYRYLHFVIEEFRLSVPEFLREQFYPFAHTVLDHLAETFCYFFGLPMSCAEMSHTRLMHAFRVICTEKGLQGDINALHALMRDLHTRIILHRISGTPMPMHDNLTDLLTCLDQYIVALLTFLAQNIEQSVFRSEPRNAQP
jgi:hypothetical protein